MLNLLQQQYKKQSAPFCFWNWSIEKFAKNSTRRVLITLDSIWYNLCCVLTFIETVPTVGGGEVCGYLLPLHRIQRITRELRQTLTTNTWSLFRFNVRILASRCTDIVIQDLTLALKLFCCCCDVHKMIFKRLFNLTILDCVVKLLKGITRCVI
jgi:hypothetical protein